jgi:hypothetical protein
MWSRAEKHGAEQSQTPSKTFDGVCSTPSLYYAFKVVKTFAFQKNTLFVPILRSLHTNQRESQNTCTPLCSLSFSLHRSLLLASSSLTVPRPTTTAWPRPHVGAHITDTCARVAEIYARPSRHKMWQQGHPGWFG